MSGRKIVFNLDLGKPSSLKPLKQQLDREIRNLEEKNDLFCQRLAQEGVRIAKTEIVGMDAIDMGNLEASITLKKGDVIQGECSYYVYTDLEYAPFVEFGTGIVGASFPHPKASDVNWEYDINHHGEEGWVFKDDEGKWHRTNGFVARPFMHNTVIWLNRIVAKVAREVFG